MQEDVRILSDSPIESAAQDSLGRGRFAASFARALLDCEDSSCLITAINGPWGSGKTSLLNLLEAELSKDTNAGSTLKPISILRFNPWNAYSLDHLIALFFTELRVAIGAKSAHKVSRKLGQRFNTLAALLQFGTLHPTYGVAMAAGSGLTSALSTLFKGRQDRTIADTKREINDLLRKRGARVFVLVDDIDRLDKQALVLLFRLLRLNADFANVTYVLAFDPQVVCNMLESEQPGHGSEYLSKIVQLPIDLPLPERQRFERIVDAEMQRFIRSTIGFQSFMKDCQSEWGDAVRWGHYRQVFQSIRDVRRYFNSLSVTYATVEGEVNLVDFLALEAIRLFGPACYGVLRANAAFLTDNSESPLTVHDSTFREDFIARLRQSTAPSGGGTSSSPPALAKSRAVFDLCQFLFPMLGPSGGTLAYSHGSRQQQYRRRRVCHPEFFGRYFILGVEANDISDELLRTLCVEGDTAALSAVIDDHFENSIARRLLGRLNDHVDDFSIESIPEAIETVFGKAVQIFGEARLMMQPAAQDYAKELILALLKRLSYGSRLAVWKDLISSTEFISLPVACSAMIIPNSGPSAPVFRELGWSSDETEEIKQICLSRMKAKAATGSLASEPALGEILYRWKRWGMESDIHAFVGQLVSSDEGLLHFLDAIASEMLSDSGQRRRFVYERNVEGLADLKMIQKRAKELQDSAEWHELDDEQQQLVTSVLHPEKGDLPQVDD